MNPTPLHIRLVEKEAGTQYQIFVHGLLIKEVDNLNIADMSRLFADVYGMPVSMDKVGPEVERVTALTSDHLPDDKVVVFDAIDYPSNVHITHARQSIARAITLRIIECAKRVNLSRNNLEAAVRIIDNPQMPGLQRVYAVQRMIDPEYAQFLAILHWVPGEPTFEFELTDIEVRKGEFGKGGEIIIGGE